MWMTEPVVNMQHINSYSCYGNQSRTYSNVTHPSKMTLNWCKDASMKHSLYSCLQLLLNRVDVFTPTLRVMTPPIQLFSEPGFKDK